MTRCHYCGENVRAAPANEAAGIATLHACADAMKLIGKQRDEALSGIADDLRIMLASSTELVDGLGNVHGYQIKTGALHRILGRMAGVGYPVAIPAVAHRATHLAAHPAGGAAAPAVVATPETSKPGWRLVPVEPTERMLADAINAVEREKFSFKGAVIEYTTPEHHLARVAYRAMLAASPVSLPAHHEGEKA